MRKRKLGLNGPELSVIGFGAWAVGGPWKWGWGPVESSQAIDAMHRALDLGVNWIDTAPVYGLGRSERLVGKAVKGRRDEVFIATKCGLRWKDQRLFNDISPKSIREEIEASLSRLDVETIDLYHIHWPNANQSESRAWQELLRLKKEGKVRWIGVSNFDAGLLEKIERLGHADSLQPPYNLVQRQAETELLPFCKSHGIGVVTYSPMLSGLLSGAFDRAKLAADDWRCKSPMFNEPELTRHLQLVETLRRIAGRYDCTVGQLAVAWVLRCPEVTSAIVGARSIQQVEENVIAADCLISKQDALEMDAMLESWRDNERTERQ